MKKIILWLALSLLPFYAFSQSVTFAHPWQGATVAFFGDSITDPGATPNKHDWTGRADTHYWGYLQEWLGVKPLVYGVSGRKWDDVANQAEQLKREHGDNFDAITIFMGTNDFIGDVPIGEWYSQNLKITKAAMGSPAKDYTWLSKTPVMDTSTLKGRINIAISTLKRLFPDKQIVILTPIHRAYATFGDENIQPDESFPNKIGVYFIEYVDAVKEAGNVWGIPVIDLNSLCGINPMVEEQVFYFSNSATDRLHPNAEGHKRLAKTLMYQLLALPCKF